MNIYTVPHCATCPMYILAENMDAALTVYRTKSGKDPEKIEHVPGYVMTQDSTPETQAIIQELRGAIRAFLVRYEQLMPYLVNDRLVAEMHGVAWSHGNWELELDRKSTR